jgi:hypothetical protein
MIEIIMLLMLGGDTDMSTQLAFNVDEQNETVDMLQTEYDILQEELTLIQTDMNVKYAEWIKLKYLEENNNDSDAVQHYHHSNTGIAKDEWRAMNSDMEDMRDRLDELKFELDTEIVLLEKMEKDLENLLKANSDTVRYSNTSISLSKNCQTMIKYELYTKCPTYRELFDMFDNSDPTVSGMMVDYGYDISREDIMKKHWKFYETYDDFELVVVDPDSDFQHKSINIEIQPRVFTSLALIGDSNTKNWTNESYTTWHNFKVDDNCKRIMVAPDLELIAEAVEFARNNCDGEMTLLENKTVKRESTEWSDRDWRSSPALVYQDWLRNAIENNKGLRLGLD